MLAAAGPVEAEARAAGDDLDLVAHVASQGLGEVQRARNAVDEGDHVDGEARLQLGHLEEVVEHDVGVGVALEGDDELGLATCRCVVDVGDAVEVTAVDELLDAPGDRRAARLVRELGDDDLHAFLALVDGRRGAQLDAAPAGAIGVEDAGSAEDAGAGREVGSLDELHEVVRA